MSQHTINEELFMEMPLGPFPSEVGTEGGGAREDIAEHAEEYGEALDEELAGEEDTGIKSAPKVFRHFQIAYDREIDGARRKKDLFWNIMQLTYRQVYVQSAQARKEETTMRPGMRILGDIPDRAWTMIDYDLDHAHTNLIFAYGLNLRNLDVQDVSIISPLTHLRLLDLSGNRMKMDSVRVVSNLPKLASLKVNMNRLSEINVPAPSLLELEIAGNRLMTIEPFELPNLERIVLSRNRLRKLQYFSQENVPNLTHFTCTHCRLKTTALVERNWPQTLTYLYLGYNKLRKIEGLDNLVNLRGLHIRSNRIKKLRGFSSKMKNLRYLNVRENKIANLKQFKKLRVLPKLKFVVCKGNPFENEKSPAMCRLAIVFTLRKLFRIDKVRKRRHQFRHALQRIIEKMKITCKYLRYWEDSDMKLDEVTVGEIETCINARDVVDNEEDSSDDDVQEDLEDYDDEYNDAPLPIWDVEDEEFVKYDTISTA